VGARNVSAGFSSNAAFLPSRSTTMLALAARRTNRRPANVNLKRMPQPCLPQTTRGLSPALPGPASDGVVVVAVATRRSDLAKLEACLNAPVTSCSRQSHTSCGIDSTYRCLERVGSPVRASRRATLSAGTRCAAEEASAHDDAPVVQVVKLLITQGLRDRASDPRRTTRRADSACIPDRRRPARRSRLPASMGPAVVSRIKILAGLNIVERRRAQDGQSRPNSRVGQSTSVSPQRR